MTDPDTNFDPAELRARTFVRHVEVHEQLPSTNTRASELANDPGTELPALVLAQRQTAGRGRGEHTWWSADGALTFSVLIDAATFGLETRAWPQLSLATAVAVCDALHIVTSRLDRPADVAKTDPASVGIKWPNDIMLNDAKVCGILIESPGGSLQTRRRVVIGIGINVNNSWAYAPPGAGKSGIALCDATHRRHDVQEVLIRVLTSLYDRIAELAAGDPQLPNAWQRLSWLSEQPVAATTNGQVIEGICRGITEDGRLVVEAPSGTHFVHTGSVRVVK